MKKPLTAAEALARAEALCARAEHCAMEIRKKLKSWGVSDFDNYKIIRHLTEKKFIDPERYARAFCHDKSEFALWGRIKIRQALYMNGIPDHIISEALASIDEDSYRSHCNRIVKAKWNSLGDEATTRSGSMKVYRYALSRGYESRMIVRIIANLRRNEPSDQAME